MHLYGKYYPDECHIKFINDMYVSELYGIFKTILDRVEQFENNFTDIGLSHLQEINDYLQHIIDCSKISYMSVYSKDGFDSIPTNRKSIRRIRDLNIYEFQDLTRVIINLYHVIKDRGAADLKLGNTIETYQWSGV